MVNSKLLVLLIALLPALALGESGKIPDRFNIAPDPEFRSLDEKVQSLKRLPPPRSAYSSPSTLKTP